MATLTALRFPTSDGADDALATLRHLAEQGRITIQDAAVVTWPQGKRKPRTRHSDLNTDGALSGAFWGLLFGLIFFVPVLGAAVGAAIGSRFGELAELGIGEDFIGKVRDEVVPGTSALFLMTSFAATDQVAAAMRQHQFTIVATNFSPEQEARLRAVFEHHEPPAG